MASAKAVLEKKKGPLTFGRTLKAWRLGENLTQKELAVKVLITEAAVSRFENGHDLPTALTLKRIARVLKADEEMFVIFIVRDMLRKKGFRDIELIAKKAV